MTIHLESGRVFTTYEDADYDRKTNTLNLSNNEVAFLHSALKEYRAEPHEKSARYLLIAALEEFAAEKPAERICSKCKHSSRGRCGVLTCHRPIKDVDLVEGGQLYISGYECHHERYGGTPYKNPCGRDGVFFEGAVEA